MVNGDIDSVTRTILVLHDIPAVVVLDKVQKDTMPSIISARYFGYNLDGEGRMAGAQDGFTAVRPLARLQAKTFAPGGTLCSVGRLQIEKERADQHPFVDATAVLSSTHPFLATVLIPEPAETSAASVVFTPGSDGALRIDVTGPNGSITARVVDSGPVPEWEIQ
jgi:hypothetical protein